MADDNNLNKNLELVKQYIQENNNVPINKDEKIVKWLRDQKQSYRNRNIK